MENQQNGVETVSLERRPGIFIVGSSNVGKRTLLSRNQVADRLANLGVDQEDKWVSHISPPEDIIPLLEADMRGVAFERL